MKQLRDRRIEDGMLSKLLECEEANTAPYTREVIEAGLDVYFDFHASDFARMLFVRRLLQGLEQRKLVRHELHKPSNAIAWMLTDDGRHEARKLKPRCGC